MSPETEWALPKEPALETVSSPLVVLMRKLPARIPTRISPEVLSASKSPSPSSSRISPAVDLAFPGTADFRFRFSTTSGECGTFFDDALSFDKKRKKIGGFK